MPGVPEIDVPMVTSEAQPSPVSPKPSLGAFPGAHIGEGLSRVGETLFQIGWAEHQKAAEAIAQQKETEFQTQALALRDKYKQMFNMDAIAAHDGVTAELAKAREKIGNSLTTKHGAALYNNNSLRNMRLIQEAIDNHFETQNKSFQFGEHRKGQDLDLNVVAKLAADGNVNGAEEKIKMMQDKTRQFAGSHGLDPDTEAALITSKAAHSLVKTLVDGHSPQAVDAYKKWGEHLDRSFQDTVQKTLATQGVATAVEKLLVNLPRVDADGKTNPRGRIDQTELRKTMDAQPADEFGGRVRDKLKLEADRLDDENKRAGDQMEDRIYRLGQGRGRNGMFGIPEGTTEWEEFKALYSKRADVLVRETHTNLRRSVTEGRADEAHTGKEAFGRAASRLYEASTEELKQITPQSVAAQVRADGGRQQDIERAQAKLASMQNAKPDHIGREIPSIAREVLNSAKKRGFAAAEQFHAIEYLDSLHTAHPDWTRAQLGDDLEKHIVKGFFSTTLKVPPPGRAPQKPAQTDSNPPPGMYRKADGSVGKWNGKAWE